jgi:AraC-like DNA-binding protein
MSVGPVTGGAKTFSADVTASGTPHEGFGAFRREWDTQVGQAWPLAGLDVARSSDFRIKVQAVQAHDGSADSAEVRLLTAHADMVAENLPDLSPAGVRGARDALLELAKGVLRREFDDAEPRLAPTLVRAAMQIADDRLADPDLSPTTLARELHVSLRTLHRAFTTTEESVAAYIRRRRLEQARLDLGTPPGRPDVAEVAARWQFADSSHFTRAFRRQYGETPAQFARSASGSPTAV